MIVAILLADRVTPAGGESPYLLKTGEETAIERAAGTILRGPFGGTVVAAAPQHSPQIRKALTGFAVQHLQLRPGPPHAALIEAIHFAQAFRARWEKAMAAAKARFGADEEDDDEEEKPSAKASKGKPADWSKHRKAGDVKVRGLARSFDRDGFMLFRAENPDIKPELQAQLVEAFGREAADKKRIESDFDPPCAAARPFAQAVHSGQRGYPILMSLPAAVEVAALPPKTDFDAWLLQHVERVQDVPV